MSSKYVRDLVEWSLGEENIDITDLVLLGMPGDRLGDATPNRTFRRILAVFRSIGLILVAKLEAIQLKRDSRYAEHLTLFDLSILVPNQLALEPAWSASGLVCRLSEPDLEALRALDLDLLIRCGSGIIRGPALTVPRLGILSFHHGDNRRYRGSPAGFWEVRDKQPTSGFVIQILSDELDGGLVLCRGSVVTQNYFLRNQAHLYGRSNVFMQDALRRLADGDASSEPEGSVPYSHRLYRSPSNLQVLGYVLSQAKRLASRMLRRRLLRKRREWGVAVVHGGWREAVLHRGAVMEAAPGTYLADPFLVTSAAGTYCFVEEFDVGRGLGSIAVYGLDGTRATRLGTALMEDFHLSFPYVFEYDGRMFMCPETSEARQIRLYEAVQYPLEWQLVSVVVDGVAAVDTVIFPCQEGWGLLTNVDRTGLEDFSSELWAFFADSPLSTKWTPHASNPVVADAFVGRNGGLLRDGEHLYRVRQSPGFGVYGARATIAHIDRCDSSAYAETEMAAIEPGFFPRIKGTHHVSSAGDFTAVDYLHDRRGR